VKVQEGEGWRLVVDPAREPFTVLIGGEGWAAELTGAEARALGVGVARLVQQHRELAGSLMAEEVLGLELEVELEAEAEPAGREVAGVLWLALEGDRDGWSLRFVLTPGPARRALEGSWTAAASLPMASALAAEAVTEGAAVCEAFGAKP
jgi:hypothetical protein